MTIRNQQKVSTINVVPGIALDSNPFSTRLGAARVLRNFIPERGRLARKTFSPQFTVKPSVAGGDVWHIRNFRYTRAGAPENRLLTFRSDGKLYQRQSSWEQEIWPGTGFSVTGENSGTVFTQTVTSDPDWTTISNAGASDDAYASVTITGSGLRQSEWLLVTGFSFAVPAGNSILGVVVKIEHNSSSTGSGNINVQLLKSGAAAGSSKDITPHPTTDVITSLGDATDLWGTSFSAGDVNASDFGVQIRISHFGLGTVTTTANVDHVTIQVFYGSPSTIAVQKPFAQQLSNRFFFSDGIIKKVYDGRNVQDWGLPRTTTAPTVTAQNLAGSIVANTGVKGAITWVVLDEENNRVHESSRTNNSDYIVVTGVNDSVRLDISALSPPSRATHWSAYISELDGSEVLRRAATTRISTTTVDVTAFPTATSPKAPIRNDPPPASTVGWVAKNRIFLRDDANPNTFYFSALGEVKGLLNGAADESFCGYGADSISDISNSDFVPDREIRGGIEHDNFIFIWSERYGYALIGELNLLDNRSPRGVRKERVFSESLAGPDAAVSTPYGLAWVNPGRKVLLWTGGGTLLDIGEPIQPSLDTVPNDEIRNIYAAWWSGNGRQWLVLTVRCSSADDDSDAGVRNRTFIYDFSHPSPRPGAETDPGTWFEWTDLAATCVGQYYDEEGSPFLLLGTTASEVRLADRILNPTHLNYSATLGETYLGATVQNNPRNVLRTGLLLPSGDLWTTGQYVQLLSGDRAGPGVPAAGSLTDPTLAYAVDIENPDLLGTGIPLTLDVATTAGDKRAWLQPEASGNTNVGGAFGKQFVFQLSYAEGNDSTGESDGRLTTRQNTLYKTGFAFTPSKEMAR